MWHCAITIHLGWKEVLEDLWESVWILFWVRDFILWLHNTCAKKRNRDVGCLNKMQIHSKSKMSPWVSCGYLSCSWMTQSLPHWVFTSCILWALNECMQCLQSIGCCSSSLACGEWWVVHYRVTLNGPTDCTLSFKPWMIIYPLYTFLGQGEDNNKTEITTLIGVEVSPGVDI